MPRHPNPIPYRPAGRAILLVVMLAVLTPALPAHAAMVAPHALFIDHRVRSTALHVHNPDDVPVEIEVQLIYGFPRGDGEGGVQVFLEEAPPADAPSCAGWIKAYPRRLTLGPGEKQIVRLLAKPPAALPDGEYWSRVVVSSQAAPEPQELEGRDGVQVGLSLGTRTIISLNYRKGPMSTGVEVSELHGWIEPEALHLDMALARRGTAAWLGRLDLVLLDGAGREVQHWDQALAVYEPLRRRLELPFEAEPQPGHYTLSMRYSTEREDLPPEGVLPSQEVLRSMALSFPDTLNE